MSELTYLVIEYVPHLMSHRRAWQPARLDGHYRDKSDAVGVADLWGDEPLHLESRIVVAKVVYEAKAPAHWAERDKGADG